MADVDGGPGTFTISNTSSTNIPYENAGRPMAFQVFNPAHAGLLLVNGAGQPTGWMPHSGNQMLAAFGDVDGQNNDWLISPELSGDAQTITFLREAIVICMAWNQSRCSRLHPIRSFRVLSE